MGDLASALKVIGSGRVRKGESAESAARSDRMNAIMDAIMCLARGDNIGRGVGIRKRVGPGSFILTADPAGTSFAAGDPDIAFFCSDATTTEGDPPEVTNKVLVLDGKINGEFPTGMGGPASEPFVLDLDTPEDSIIYAEITFDAETLEITSREINQSASGSVPEQGIDGGTGSFIIMIAFTYFDEDDAFRIIMTHLGNIDFELISVRKNGKPAVLAIPAYGKILELPEDVVE